MSLNWIFGIVAIAFWVVATLLYLRRPITQWIAAWREQRAALAAGRAAQAKKV